MTKERAKKPLMILVLASGNQGKIAELRDLLKETPFIIHSCADYPSCPELPETGDSFEANARIKAGIVSRFTGHWTLGDDSGLEVDALHGAPGIYSASFAGEQASDAENKTLLLDRLSVTPEGQRSAQFRCVLALAAPDGRMWTVEGICRGRIGAVPKGARGFGYDPLFVPEGYDQTFAELDSGVKNRISHRARALERLKALLETLPER